MSSEILRCADRQIHTNRYVVIPQNIRIFINTAVRTRILTFSLSQLRATCQVLQRQVPGVITACVSFREPVKSARIFILTTTPLQLGVPYNPLHVPPLPAHPITIYISCLSTLSEHNLGLLPRHLIYCFPWVEFWPSTLPVLLV